MVMARKTNVTINNRSYYRVTATIGKKTDGTAIRKQFYGSCRREAVEKRDEYMFQLKQGLCIGFDKRALVDAFKEWFEHVHAPTLSLSSISRYETLYRLRIQPSGFALIKLADVKALHIQMFYSSMLKDKVSANTVRKIHQLLCGFFAYCVNTDLIAKNPILAVEPPKERKMLTRRSCLEKTDVEKIVAHVKENMEDFIFVFAVLTGLRQGEILALTHEDINVENGFITINKSVNYLTVDGVYQAVLSTTKTVGSIRQVPLLENLKPMLLAHMEAEREKHTKKGIKFSDRSILFSSESCRYVDGRNLRKRLQRLYNRLGIESTTFHGLRHTFCSVLAENGVNPKTTSELMGHSDTRTTLKIYTHVHKEEKKRGIATLASVFPM